MAVCGREGVFFVQNGSCPSAATASWRRLLVQAPDKEPQPPAGNDPAKWQEPLFAGAF